jgi:hyperosmotically inducible periplasmic protein
MNWKRYPIVMATAAVAMFTTGTTLFANETDNRIESSFKKTYVYQTYLKDDSVKAEAKAGIVTLTGTVVEASHKSLVQDTAASLPGVIRVDNRPETKAEAATDNADTWIGRKVKLALVFHRNVNAGKTDIAVKDGNVTLSGEASSMAQKELTTEYARDIEGVKDVQNDMTVAAAPATAERTVGAKMDDASITAQVKMALLTHRSTSALNTGVKTLDGEVTLTGIARNQAEKSLVTKFVTDIRGVTGVKNKMTVEVAKAT